MQRHIVISDCDHDNIEPELEVLKKHGLRCELRKCVKEQEVIDGCKDATVLIVQYAQITRRAMQELPNLKQVVRYGVGVDTVDVDAATEHGVQICNVPDYGTNEVADQAMAHTLYLMRKLYKTNEDIRAGCWDYTRAKPIRRMSCLSAGIIGLGRIGKQYAKRMHAFGFQILAADPAAFDVPDYVSIVPLETLLKQADVISIHCPSDGNIDLISEREIAMMKDGVYIINTARGGILNEDALEKALSSGKVAGAGLDVASKEPIPADHPLLRHKNASVSPHIAWHSEEAARELKRKVAEEAVRFITGQPVHYPVNTLK